jgi:hypothetical protein
VLGGSGIAPLALERKAAAERDARVKAVRELQKLPDREPLLDHTACNSSSNSSTTSDKCSAAAAAVAVVVVPETAMRRASRERSRRYTVRCEALSR